MLQDLLVTYPSQFNTSTGTATAVLAQAPFKAWCNADATCSSSSTVGLSLISTPIAAVLDNISNWPTYITSDGSAYTSYDIVSNYMLEFAITGVAGKVSGSPICSSTSTCTALLSMTVTEQPVSGLTQPSFLCLRLVPNPTNSSAYDIVGGYPDGLNGVRASAFVSQNTISCNTSYLGHYLIAQFLRPSPPPSPLPPPSPPPPPPMPVVTGLPSVNQGSASILFQAMFGLSFDTLAANSSLLTNFTRDVPYWLAIRLGFIYPSYFVDQSNNLPYYNRVNISVITRATVAGSVIVYFKLLMPVGVTGDQLQVLSGFITNATGSTLFLGSQYLSLLQGTFVVTSVDSGSTEGLSLQNIIIITCVCGGVIVFVVLVVSAVLSMRKYEAILPKKERVKEHSEEDEERRRERRKKRKSKREAEEGKAELLDNRPGLQKGLQLEEDPPMVHDSAQENLMGGGGRPPVSGHVFMTADQPQMMPQRAFVPMPMPMPNFQGPQPMMMMQPQPQQQMPMYAVGPNGQPMMVMPQVQQRPVMMMGPNGQPVMVMQQQPMY